MDEVLRRSRASRPDPHSGTSFYQAKSSPPDHYRDSTLLQNQTITGRIESIYAIDDPVSYVEENK